MIGTNDSLYVTLTVWLRFYQCDFNDDVSDRNFAMLIVSGHGCIKYDRRTHTTILQFHIARVSLHCSHEPNLSQYDHYPFNDQLFPSRINRTIESLAQRSICGCPSVLVDLNFPHLLC
jgi:hypothetical protein